MIKPEDFAATWTIVSEKAGAPGLVGLDVRLEIQQINPMMRRAVITPRSGGISDERYVGVFSKLKPSVVSLKEDTLSCALGIVAKKKP